jgi:hypothetical protein
VTRVDSVALTDIITTAFDLSMDGRLRPAERQGFLVAGKRLRGALVNLLTARFDAGTAELEAANGSIRKVNGDLKASAQSLAQIAERLQELSTLAGSLDALLSVAAGFH